jgi:hypothetical protein
MNLPAGIGRDAFHCVPNCRSKDGDAVERVPTGFRGSRRELVRRMLSPPWEDLPAARQAGAGVRGEQFKKRPIPRAALQDYHPHLILPSPFPSEAESEDCRTPVAYPTVCSVRQRNVADAIASGHRPGAVEGTLAMPAAPACIAHPPGVRMPSSVRTATGNGAEEGIRAPNTALPNSPGVAKPGLPALSLRVALRGKKKGESGRTPLREERWLRRPPPMGLTGVRPGRTCSPRPGNCG